MSFFCSNSCFLVYNRPIKENKIKISSEFFFYLIPSLMAKHKGYHFNNSQVSLSGKETVIVSGWYTGIWLINRVISIEGNWRCLQKRNTLDSSVLQWRRRVNKTGRRLNHQLQTFWTFSRVILDFLRQRKHRVKVVEVCSPVNPHTVPTALSFLLITK